MIRSGVSPKKIAMAVRKPDGEIIIEEKEVKGTGNWGKIPLIRGVIAFIQGLVGSTSRVNSRFRYCGTMFFTTLFIIPAVICIIMMMLSVLHEGKYDKLDYFFKDNHYKILKMEGPYKSIIIALSKNILLFPST